MSEPIKVGDLVQVVRPMECCGDRLFVGAIFAVGVLEMNVQHMCRGCGRLFRNRWVASGDGKKMISVVRLKPYRPLSELEGEKRDEEITA